MMDAYWRQGLALLGLGASSACAPALSTPGPADPQAFGQQLLDARAEARSAGVRLPALFSPNHIFLRATIAGAPALLLFDSGSSVTMLNPEYAARLHLQPRGRKTALGIGPSTASTELFDGVPIQLGSATVKPTIIVSWREANLPTYNDEVPDGVIGRDLLQAYAVELNLASGTVTAFDTTSVLLSRADQVVLPMRVVHGVPLADVSIHGRAPASETVSVVVDYGSSATLLLAGRQQAYPAMRSRLADAQPQRVLGLGGERLGIEGVVDSVTVAGLRVSAPLVFVDSSDVPALSSVGAQGLIGTGLLRQFIVTLDYRHSRAILIPIRQTTRVARGSSGNGLRLRSAGAGGTWRVTGVDPTSPAARSGVHRDDILMAVDGVAIRQLARAEVDAMLIDSRTGHILDLRRQGVSGIVRVVLQADPP